MGIKRNQPMRIDVRKSKLSKSDKQFLFKKKQLRKQIEVQKLQNKLKREKIEEVKNNMEEDFFTGKFP